MLLIYTHTHTHTHTHTVMRGSKKRGFPTQIVKLSDLGYTKELDSVCVCVCVCVCILFSSCSIGPIGADPLQGY